MSILTSCDIDCPNRSRSHRERGKETGTSRLGGERYGRNCELRITHISVLFFIRWGRKLKVRYRKGCPPPCVLTVRCARNVGRRLSFSGICQKIFGWTGISRSLWNIWYCSMAAGKKRWQKSPVGDWFGTLPGYFARSSYSFIHLLLKNCAALRARALASHRASPSSLSIVDSRFIFGRKKIRFRILRKI